jgi:GNAT superfamily N-acetyltransferase
MARTPPPDFRITPATEHDVPLILDLIRALADYERMADQVVATESSLRASLFGDRRSAEVLLASVGGASVGFAVFFHNYSTFLGRAGLYLEDLFVRPEWRSRGIGQAMLRHVARVAVDRGCGRMEWSVLDWNAPAIRVYQATGAVPMDEWTIYRLTGAALTRFASVDASGNSDTFT